MASRIGIVWFMFVVIRHCLAGEEMKARLVNGNTDAGRLEIFFNRKWSTVCGRGFGKEEAMVACKMLGYNSTDVTAVSSARYGQGSGLSQFYSFQCLGTETSLAQCQPVFNFFCSHRQDVGVMCNTGEEMKARLANGDSAAGRLEIIFNGEWSTVCGIGFGKEEAMVACRMLGHNSTDVAAISSARYGRGSGSILFDSLQCVGTETSLAQCEHDGPYYSLSCYHPVGVVCGAAAEEMKARLVNGDFEAGRLEIFFNREWSTVCGDGFGKEEAIVACRMLGYNSTDVAVVSSARYGQGSGSILFDSLQCVGTETSLAQCEHDGPYYTLSCSHQDDIGVMCNTGEEMKARLVNGDFEAGRLEIFFNREWSTVCGRGFGKEEAMVACRMLGYNSTDVAAVSSNRYGPGSGSILFVNLQCVGTEPSLAQCQHDGPYYSLSRTHWRDVGVTCNTGEEIKLRLVNGDFEAGRLEIFFNREWSTVCGRGFGKEEAMVVCRMLGYNSTDVAAVSATRYGEGSGSILFDSLRCVGTVTSLAQCQHGESYYSYYCSHQEDVGVICNTELSASVDFRLAGTRRTSQQMGRVEIRIMGRWIAVCGNNFSRSDAKVICRQLGYPTNAAMPLSRSSFGPRQEKRMLLVDYTCMGNESTILDCANKVHGYSEHCNTEEFSVLCSNSSTHIYVLIETNEANIAYPLAEGTTATLKCESTQFDQTAVNYAWPETGGGRPSGEYLTFDNVSRAHHGHQVRCMASYNYSANTELISTEPLVMQVYYNPIVRVTSDVESCQPQTTDVNLCVVTQNENVTLVCESDSNPTPVRTTWSGKINSTRQHLHIISADPTIHDGLYTCTVNNTPDDGDRRLNFVSSYRFSVTVQYPPTELRFRANGVDNRTVTVAENTEDVDLVCRAKGRPSPRIRVVNNTDDQLLGAQPQDDIQSTKTMGKVFLPVRKIQCEASGNYTCTADNPLERASQTITLLVLCAPKRRDVESRLPVLTFGESKPQLNVEMTAFPTPFVKSKTYQRFHKHDSEGSARVEDRIHAVCISRSSVSASVTCTISVVNATEADEGVCQIVFTNGLGDVPFNFTVRRQGVYRLTQCVWPHHKNIHAKKTSSKLRIFKNNSFLIQRPHTGSKKSFIFLRLSR